MIVPQPMESFESVLKRFKKACDKDVMPELKRRRFYAKPSERKRDKHLSALQRRRKAGLNQ